MRSFRQIAQELVQDPAEAAEYLTAALEEYENDGNLPAFLTAIRTVVEAQGGIGRLAEKTNLNRQHLYRSLSEKGNPTIRTLNLILQGIGVRLTIRKAS